MKKKLFTLLAVLVARQPRSVCLRRCRDARSTDSSARRCADSSAGRCTDSSAGCCRLRRDYKPATDKPKKIAFFVSDLSNVFHQGQATEAQKYAKEKYGAEVFVFDGKADSAR